MRRIAQFAGWLLVAAGILSVLATVVVLALLPESFASSAKVASAATSPAMFNAAAAQAASSASLHQVITNLNLTAAWGRKYKQPGELSEAQCMTLLQKMIVLNLPVGGGLLEFKVFSDSPDEAAAIANGLASVCLRATPGASLVEQARPNPRPARPNKRKSLLIACGVGAVLAVNGIILVLAGRRASALVASDLTKLA